MKRKVRVKGPGVKLNNIWCYIDEVAVIDEAQYEENKEYVEVIEEIEENPNTKLKEENKSVDGSDINVGTNETEKEISEEQPKEESEDNIGENTQEDTGENGEDNESKDEELEALKERAAKLGIKVTSNMKKETIINKIEEKEAEEDKKQNPGGEPKDGTDTNDGANTEENPKGE